MARKALITGITGQDGSYLAELLLEKGYEVHGVARRVSDENQYHRFSRINHILPRITLHSGDVANSASVSKIILNVQPDECYHLAAQSFVADPDEFTTMDNNIHSTHYLLNALKNFAPHCRFYFAGSSEMFGLVRESPQNENTFFHPRSAYAISKVAGFNLARYYKEAFNLFVSSGILFNHESKRRGYQFVTRKITLGVAKIISGLTNELKLGNLEVKRDWGYAPDYVKAMWLMLQQNQPDDYVIATNEMRTVKEFAELAFSLVGLNWENYVKVDEELLRPAEVPELRGDYSKAQKILGWKPKVKFHELVKIMIESDLKLFKAI